MSTSYLKEFDYDLWTSDDGTRCWVRIKSTGEETEVSRDVLRELQKEQERLKRLRKKPKPNSGKAAQRAYEINHPLTLDVSSNESDDSFTPAWQISKDTPEQQASAVEIERILLKNLTKRQRDCYLYCVVAGKSVSSYAKKCGISKQSAHETFVQIKQKLKKLVDVP